MIFSSYSFLFLFLPIVVLGYYLLVSKKRYQLSHYWILASSLFFYSYWNIYYLPLLLGSILGNYYISNKMRSIVADSKRSIRRKKVWLVLGIALNLFFLGYFKYRDFFIGTVNDLSGLELPILKLALPLGISFYSLQQVTYIVDTYEGLTQKIKLSTYAFFVSFFPQLIAGPIVHYREIIPNLLNDENRKLDWKNINMGIYLIVCGLFKKVMIADLLSPLVNMGHAANAQLTFIEAWVTSISYTFQLYFDFSGYSDMAIGIALLFNINLPINFNMPYRRTNIIDFWKYWHITLSRFITTYLFTPMVRSFNKITFKISLISIFISMSIAGLWHGADWNFILFGVIHGTALVINHLWKKKAKKLRLPRPLAWFITFNIVNISFVIFRCQELQRGFTLLKTMFNPSEIVMPHSLQGILGNMEMLGITFGNFHLSTALLYKTIVILFALFVYIWKCPETTESMKNFKPTPSKALLLSILFTLSIFSMSRVQEFLYFNF